jgi:F0F1-type ATP synthase beta subunit
MTRKHSAHKTYNQIEPEKSRSVRALYNSICRYATTINARTAQIVAKYKGLEDEIRRLGRKK